MILTEKTLYDGFSTDMDVSAPVTDLFNFDELGSLEDEFLGYIRDEIEEDPNNMPISKPEDLTYLILAQNADAVNNDKLAEWGYTFTWEQIEAAVMRLPIVIVPRTYNVTAVNRASKQNINLVSKNCVYNGVDCTAFYSNAGIQRIDFGTETIKWTITCTKK